MGLLFAKSDLSPFLYNGLITEYFNLSGNVPVTRILLNIRVKGDDTNEWMNDRTFYANKTKIHYYHWY
jgi:hypothetical protein